MADELDADLAAAPGFVEPPVADELPGLRLHWLSVQARDGASPPHLVDRLLALSNRYRGAAVVAMRTQPIPRAYRTFFRQIGLDPDTTRIPSEEAALGRLFHGAFRSHGRFADALLVSLVETGIPIWALDADRVDVAGPGIRTARAGERLGTATHARYLEPGTLVVADALAVHAVLFGPQSDDSAVTRATSRAILYSVAVAGVPDIHIEEAFWLAVEGLRS
jgi:DNA/RNA-binding domain of Phe-tRNA-synthetase-like protein